MNISYEKDVPSNERTLVIDKCTHGNGWVIDHHPTNPYTKENVILFSTSGEIPASRLTYLALGRKENTDTFISATAEITDALHRTGSINGSLAELYMRAPYYFDKSKVKNQFLKSEEIYSISDALSIISDKDPQYAFGLGLSFYDNLPKSLDGLIDMLDAKNRALIERYICFVKGFELGHFDEVNISNKMVRIIDRRSIGEFCVSASEMMRRKDHGNYVIFNGRSISIRANDDALIKTIIARLNGITYSYGGRAGAFGVKFNLEMDYDSFKEMLVSG